MSQFVASASPANPPSIAPAERDRVVRVFVSSTFRDMVEDRNALMAQVWPALRQPCRGRAVEFVAVDLRWGIAEAMSQRQETLRHCLAEIKRCRPYFIGLLGERYGWAPGPEAYTAALLQEENWLAREVAQHSITELEILHGVLNDLDMATRAFFYCRDPAYAQARGSDFLAEDATGAARQQALKERVRAVCRQQQIPLREEDQYRDPRALARLVLADLTAAINAEFPADQAPDAWTRENRDHDAYAQSRRTRFYVGRDRYYQRLDAFARDGADGQGLRVLAFAHDHLRTAVERRYLPTTDTAQALRPQLADAFAQGPTDARQSDELPWLLRQAEARERLRDCLLDIERFLLIQARDQNELLEDWVWLGEERSMGQPYLDRFAHWERASGNDTSPPRFGFVANQLGYFLNYAGLYVAAEPLYRRTLEARERVLGPAHLDTLTSVNNLAGLLQDKGDLAAAEPLYRRAVTGLLSISRSLGQPHPNLNLFINNYTGLLMQMGRSREQAIANINELGREFSFEMGG